MRLAKYSAGSVSISQISICGFSPLAIELTLTTSQLHSSLQTSCLVTAFLYIMVRCCSRHTKIFWEYNWDNSHNASQCPLRAFKHLCCRYFMEFPWKKAFFTHDSNYKSSKKGENMEDDTVFTFLFPSMHHAVHTSASALYPYYGCLHYGCLHSSIFSFF